ncbi:transmembrane protein 116-like [Grus japonensis]|uniref:Transmembrane protein 116-like n=1 Tax=Grus japonensis TaxID=30415 RepID=A0ABC9VQP9_GRUJA
MANEEEQPSALSDDELRPLFLLALADFLAAAVLLSMAVIQLLPAPLFVPAYAACPYGLMLATTFYAVSFLMVVVYAYEAYRTIHGWRAWHVAALQYVGRKDVGLEGKIIFFLYLLLVLSCCTALTVSLQGFLHSLVYGWLRQNFRQEAVGKRPSLQAFYDESLGAVP